MEHFQSFIRYFCVYCYSMKYNMLHNVLFSFSPRSQNGRVYIISCTSILSKFIILELFDYRSRTDNIMDPSQRPQSLRIPLLSNKQKKKKDAVYL